MPLHTRLHLQIARNSADFLALRQDWSDLERISPNATIFNTWGWLYPWWNIYGTGHRLFLLIARVEHRLVGVLPLYIRVERVAGIRNVRVLRMIGSGGDTSPDYLNAIAATGHEEAFITAALDLLKKNAREWDIARLTDMPCPSGLLDALCGDHLRGVASTPRISYQRIPIITLTTDWQTYVAALGASHRGQLARRQRKLATLASMRLSLFSDAERLDQVFDTLKALHVMRWRDAPAHPAFVAQSYIDFHRAVVTSLFREDRIRLYCLYDGDDIVAIYYCYKFKNEVSYFQSGFNPRYGHLSPGMLTLAFAIEQAIGEGCKTFDLLKGDYDYKRLWSNDYRQTASVIIFKQGLIGWICRAYLDYWPTFKAFIKRSLGFNRRK